MEQLYNGYTLELSPGAFPLSTDSVALADFVQPGRRANILDLGSGCGTLGLLLCAAHPDCRITGIELDEQAHRMALRNAQVNGIEDRLTSICANLAHISTMVKAGSFSCCVSNPPYFSAGPQSKTLPFARRDDLCSMDTLMAAASWALKFGGDFFLVHRPEKLAELFAYASRYHMEAKRLRLLRHKEGGPVTLVLVQCRKGAKPGLIWEEEFLHDSRNNPCAYYRKLYHL